MIHRRPRIHLAVSAPPAQLLSTISRRHGDAGREIRASPPRGLQHPPFVPSIDPRQPIVNILHCFDLTRHAVHPPSRKGRDPMRTIYAAAPVAAPRRQRHLTDTAAPSPSHGHGHGADQSTNDRPSRKSVRGVAAATPAQSGRGQSGLMPTVGVTPSNRSAALEARSD